jgi:hypothetical protein
MVECGMKVYTFLFVDNNDEMTNYKRIVCPGDVEAVDAAGKESGNHRAVQILAGDRQIGIVGNKLPDPPRRKHTKTQQL